MTYDQGSIILIQFPFTDLTGSKKRPAIIISPNWFNDLKDDVVIIAITSSKSNPTENDIEVSLKQNNLSDGNIVKDSVVLISKIFLCHKSKIKKKVAQINKEKLREISDKLQSFFRTAN